MRGDQVAPGDWVYVGIAGVRGLTLTQVVTVDRRGLTVTVRCSDPDCPGVHRFYTADLRLEDQGFKEYQLTVAPLWSRGLTK